MLKTLGIDPHRETDMAEKFTAKQGQYLAFIYNYSVMFGQPPAEADLQRFFGTSPPLHAHRTPIARRAHPAYSVCLFARPCIG